MSDRSMKEFSAFQKIIQDTLADDLPEVVSGFGNDRIVEMLQDGETRRLIYPLLRRKERCPDVVFDYIDDLSAACEGFDPKVERQRVSDWRGIGGAAMIGLVPGAVVMIGVPAITIANSLEVSRYDKDPDAYQSDAYDSCIESFSTRALQDISDQLAAFYARNGSGVSEFDNTSFFSVNMGSQCEATGVEQRFEDMRSFDSMTDAEPAQLTGCALAFCLVSGLVIVQASREVQRRFHVGDDVAMGVNIPGGPK